MAKETLVSNDRDIQGLVLQALSRTQFPVTFCDWNDVEELDEAQLIVATSWYDSKGPLTTYSALVDALQAAGLYEQIPMRRVYLKSPNDPLVKVLESEIKNPIEGFLHMLRFTHDGSYSVVFAPLYGAGGFVPSQDFRGKDARQNLLDFLCNKLRLGQRTIEDALSEIDRLGHTSIPARFTTRQLRRWRLA